jgi:hypothetical protein
MLTFAHGWRVSRPDNAVTGETSAADCGRNELRPVCNWRVAVRQQAGSVVLLNHPSERNVVKPLFTAAVLAAALISGCSSLSDSAKAPSAGATSASDVGAHAFPQATDQGKF